MTDHLTSSQDRLKQIAQARLHNAKFAVYWATERLQELDKAVHSTLQTAVNVLYQSAEGMFQADPYELMITSTGMQSSESQLQSQWRDHLATIFNSVSLELPAANTDPQGNRYGTHRPEVEGVLDSICMEYASVFDPVSQN